MGGWRCVLFNVLAIREDQTYIGHMGHLSNYLYYNFSIFLVRLIVRIAHMTNMRLCMLNSCWIGLRPWASRPHSSPKGRFASRSSTFPPFVLCEQYVSGLCCTPSRAFWNSPDAQISDFIPRNDPLEAQSSLAPIPAAFPRKYYQQFWEYIFPRILC